VIYARCTHLGCTPDWKPSENKFKMPLPRQRLRQRRDQLRRTGATTYGPSEGSKWAADGQIIVDTSRLYQWPKGQPSHFNDPGSILAGVAREIIG